MKKRILSFLLILTMLLPMCCISVYAAAPVVVTSSAKNIGETKATLVGKVTKNHGIEISTYGFGWCVEGTTNWKYKVFSSSSNGHPINNEEITHTITGLTPGTEYRYYFFAQNVNGEENTPSYKYFETDEEVEILSKPTITFTKSGTKYTIGTAEKYAEDIVQCYSGDTITFGWNSVSNASSYAYAVKKLSGTTPNPSSSNEPGTVVKNSSSTTSRSVSVTLEEGLYKFTVGALGSSSSYEDSDWSYAYLKVSKKVVVLSQPTITITRNGTKYTIGTEEENAEDIVQCYSGDTITFGWNSVSNASSYAYAVKKLSGTTPNPSSSNEPGTVIKNSSSTTSRTVSVTLEEGLYKLSVGALSSSSSYTNSDWSYAYLKVESSTPKVSSVTPSSTSIYTGKSVTFTATAKNTTKVVFYAKSTDSSELVYLDAVTGTGTSFKYTRSEGFNRSGTRTIYAYPCDASGNEQRSNGSSTTLSVLSRGTLGEVRNVSPTNGASVLAGETLRISWSSPSAPSGGAFRYNVLVTNSSGNQIYNATEISNTYVDVPASKITAGTYSIAIYAVCPEYDANNGYFSSFTAKNSTTPIVSNVTPSSTSVYTGKSVTFTATAKNTTKVVFYAKSTDSSELVYLGAVTGTGTSFKYTRAEGFNRSGTRTIYAYPCDTSGNEQRSNGSSTTLSVISRGTLGEVRNVLPINGATVLAGSALRISWTAPSAPSGGAFRYNVIVTNSSGNQIYNATEISNTYVDVPASKITAGTYSIAIYAICPEYDANNGYFSSFTAKTDVGTPKVTGITPSPTSVYTGKSITFTATAQNTSKVVFYAKETNSSTLVYLGEVTGSGTSFKYTRSEGFNRSGTRTIYAYPCDASGNEQRSNGTSISLEVKSRGTLGEVRNVSPANGATVNAGQNLHISWTSPAAPSGGAFRYNVVVTNSSGTKIYNATEITNTYVDVDASKITAGTYSIAIYAVCPEYDANNGYFSSFNAKTAAEIPKLHTVKITNSTINVDEELEFVVETSTNANNVLISYDDYNEPLKATAYRYTTSVSGDKKTWKIYLPIKTPSPQRTFRVYAAIDDTRSKESAVVTATVIGKANIESDYIEYTPTSPKVGDTITFVVNTNQYTDKISLDIGGTEYSTSTSYTDSGYLRKFTISYAFQSAGTKTINFYAWKDGSKNAESKKTENVYVAENSKKLANVIIESPYSGYSHVQGKILNVSWKNNASVVPDTYSVFLNGTALGVTSDTSFSIDSSLLTTIGEYNIDIYATKEGYTPSDGTRVTINVIASSITTTFNADAVTLVKGDTFAFSGKVSSKTLLEKVTITILNVDTNTGETFVEKGDIRRNSFDLSTLGSFVIGETYMKEPGNYQIRVFAKEYNNDGIEIANKPVVVSASNALVTKFEANTYDTYTGVDIKFTVTASNTRKVIFEVDGYNIGTANGTGTFTLNYTGFNTPGTRTVWAYPCDSNGDAVRTNGKSVTIEVDSYGTIGQAQIAYPTSTTQVNTYEDLTIKWTGANSNCKYNVTVYDPNDDKIASLTETAETELTIDGDDITTVGTYTISIYSVCDYYSPSYASATFYVTAENAIIEGFDNTPATRKIGDTIELEGTVKVDKGYIETITVNIWGPNTKSDGGTHRSIPLSGNLKSYDISNIDDIIVGQDPMDKVGKYWVNVRVRTKGDNEAALIGTKEVTVVSESSITLNAPVITSSLDVVKDADYTLTWTDVDNANLYEIKIPDLGFKESVAKNIEYVKIPKKYLNEIGTFDIQVRAINTKDSSYQDGITSTELIVKETADVMRIIRIEYPETNTVPEGTNLKVNVITDDGRARLSRIGVRHVNNDLSYTWVSTFHAKAYTGDDIENALEWNIEIPVNLLENNRTLTLVLYDFLLIEKDTHDITFNCVENHNTMGNMSFINWYAESYDETERPIWWNAPQGLPSAVDYYLADLTHNGETKRIRQNGTDIISGTEPSLTIPADMLSDLGEYTLTMTAYKEGYRKQTVSAAFTVICSHHDKYVREDETRFVYNITEKVDNIYHNVSLHKYGICTKCSSIVDLGSTIIKQAHSESGMKIGEKNGKVCACGYLEQGEYSTWEGYIQTVDRLYNVFDFNEKKLANRYIDVNDKVKVLGSFQNYYYIQYPGKNDEARYGFVYQNDIGEKQPHASDYGLHDTKEYDINVIDDDSDTILFIFSQIYDGIHVPFQKPLMSVPETVEFGVGDKTLGKFTIRGGYLCDYVRIKRNEIPKGSVWYLYKSQKVSPMTDSDSGWEFDGNRFVYSHTQDNFFELYFGALSLFDFGKSIGKQVLKNGVPAAVNFAVKEKAIDIYKDIAKDEVVTYVSKTIEKYKLDKELNDVECKKLIELWVETGFQLGLSFKEFEDEYMRMYSKCTGNQNSYQLTAYGPVISFNSVTKDFSNSSYSYDAKETTGVTGGGLDNAFPDYSNLNYYLRILIEGYAGQNYNGFKTNWDDSDSEERKFITNMAKKLITFSESPTSKAYLLKGFNEPALLLKNTKGEGLLIFYANIQVKELFKYTSTQLFVSALSAKEVEVLFKTSDRAVNCISSYGELRQANDFFAGGTRGKYPFYGDKTKEYDITDSQASQILSVITKDKYYSVKSEHLTYDLFEDMVREAFSEANIKIGWLDI